MSNRNRKWSDIGDSYLKVPSRVSWYDTVTKQTSQPRISPCRSDLFARSCPAVTFFCSAAENTGRVSDENSTRAVCAWRHALLSQAWTWYQVQVVPSACESVWARDVVGRGGRGLAVVRVVVVGGRRDGMGAAGTLHRLLFLTTTARLAAGLGRIYPRQRRACHNQTQPRYSSGQSVLRIILPILFGIRCLLRVCFQTRSVCRIAGTAGLGRLAGSPATCVA